MGTIYPDLEPGNEFWNRIRVPGSQYKSLTGNKTRTSNRNVIHIQITNTR